MGNLPYFPGLGASIYYHEPTQLCINLPMSDQFYPHLVSEYVEVLAKKLGLLVKILAS